MKTIPVLDLQAEIKHLKPRIMQALEAVIEGTSFIMGPNVHQLERELAEYLQVKHAITLNSGTDALVIALQAAGIGPGDEVLTTPFTFFATAEAISQVGARPVFVDIDEHTFMMDLEQIPSYVNEHTKAIVPVHLYGRPIDMERLLAISAEHGLKVIEDTAQAFGAAIGGKFAGTFGLAGCYSFFPSKNLGAYGDGGLLVTNDDQVAEQAAMLRVHGSKRKYWNEVIGYNSRLDEIQAAILRVKLPMIAEWNEARRRVAERYDEGLRRLEQLIVPEQANAVGHVYHQYTIRVLHGKRSYLQEQLKRFGIGSMVYYPTPVHKLPVYARLTQRAMPVAERLSEEVLSLPIGPYLTEEDQSSVIQAIKTIVS